MLKRPYFGHLIGRADSLEKTLTLGKIEGRRRSGQQRMRWLDGITDQWTWVWTNSGRWWRTGKPGVLPFMGSQRVGHGLATEQQWDHKGEAGIPGTYKVSLQEEEHTPELIYALCPYTGERTGEDTARRWLGASQEESPYQNTNMNLRASSGNSSL